LQGAHAAFEERGLGLAAITYDSQPTLEDFAERKGIDYPLLADPTTETIRSWGLLDPDSSRNNIPDAAAPNVAYPGYFLVDREGIVRERFLDGAYNDRRTASGVLGALFPELFARESRSLEAPHAKVALSQSDREVVPGSRLTLAVELALPPLVHVYASGAKGYRPLELALEASPAFTSSPVRFPPAGELRLPAAKEVIPVHEGRVLLRQEILMLGTSDLFRRLQASPEKRVTLVFPSPYLRHEPTPLLIERMDGSELVAEQRTVSYEEAFRAELHHFRDCIAQGRRPETSVEDALGDARWIRSIARAFA